MDDAANVAVEKALDEIAAAARRRLEEGASATELLDLLRPTPPIENARRRRPGPPGALWVRPDTPLLGLSYLRWKEPEARLRSRIHAGLPGAATSLAIRVARPEVLGGWWLAHVMFGAADLVDHDVFGVASPSGGGQPDKVIKLDWRGKRMAEAQRESGGDLAAYPEDYLRLFGALIASEAGRFPIVESADAGEERARSIPLPAPRLAEMRAALRRRGPIEFVGILPNGTLSYRATIHYNGTLQQCDFELGHQGSVRMLNAQMVWQ